MECAGSPKRCGNVPRGIFSRASRAIPLPCWRARSPSASSPSGCSRPSAMDSRMRGASSAGARAEAEDWSNGDDGLSQRPTGELVRDLFEEARHVASEGTRLVRAEIESAKQEIANEV